MKKQKQPPLEKNYAPHKGEHWHSGLKEEPVQFMVVIA